MFDNVNTGPATWEAAKSSVPPDAKSATAATAKPKAGDDTEPGLRLHDRVPDYRKYLYGYPLTAGRLFGSGN